MGASGGPLDAQSQQLNVGISKIASGTGTATFTFQSPPNGQTWTGTLNCAAANTGTVFSVAVGAVNWGSFGGNSVYGPVQVFGSGGQQLIVTATGLTANTSYEMYFIGSADPSAMVAPIWPDSNSTALTAQISGTVPISGSVAVSGGSLTSVGSISNTVSTSTQASYDILATRSGTYPYSANLTALSPYQGIGIIIAQNPGQIYYIQVANANTGESWITTMPASVPLNEVFAPIQCSTGDTVAITVSASVSTAGQVQVLGFRYAPSVMVENAPNNSLDIVSYGGTLQAQVTSVGSGGVVAVLAAPAAGYAHRLHSVTVPWQSAASGGGINVINTATSKVIGSAPIVINSGIISAYSYLAGQLCTGGVSVSPGATGVTVAVISITYDLVFNPSIS